MKLAHSAASPYVRKVNACAIARGIDGKIERWKVGTTDPALLEFNPLSKVPTLITDDGVMLYDSPVICEYLDSIGSAPKLFPAAGPARWKAICQQALGDGILDALILCRYETTRPEDRRWAGWTDGQMKKAHQGLATAEREDLSGPRTIGHVTLGCTLGYLDFRFPNDGWRQRHPGLAAWYREAEQLPSMQATKPPAS